MSDADKANWKPRANPWIIAVSVTMAAFMEVLDTTIVNVSLPHIAGSMSASYDDATWTLTAYLVANGIVLPISGFLARFFGRKRYFVICIAAFTICSFLCGVSTNLGELIVFRLLQGFFGGGLQPNQQSIILDTFEPAQRGRAFSVTAVAIVVAPVLGPTLGGWITDNFTWRWVFLINVPIGIMTVLAVMHVVEDPPWQKPAAKGKPSIDFIGISLIALGLGCLQVVMDRGEDDDWFGSLFICLFAALSAIGILGAIAWLLYTRKPVVNLRVMKDRNFATGCATIAAFGAILYGSSVLMPQLAQQHLGYTATLAGLVLSPGALLITALIPLVSKLMPVVQTRHLVAFGFFALGVALFYAHGLNPQVNFGTLVKMRMAQSFALAFLFVPTSTLAYVTLAPELNEDAAALFTMFRNVAGSIGISMATAEIQQRTQVRLAYLVHNMTPLYQPYVETLHRIEQSLRDYTGAVGNLTQSATAQLYQMFVAQASILAYLDIFAVCGIFAWCFIPFTFLFSPTRASGGGGK
jgi:DHA2 family multidrug resistance protein